MMIRPNAKNLISHIIGVFALLVTNAIPSLADGDDPTAPSSQITDLLMMHGGAMSNADKEENKNEIEDEPSVKRPILRLKAIVLRDQDNGTAIISNNDSENYVITLQRTHLLENSRALSIGGISLMVKEFAEASVTLQSLDNTQQFIVN